MNTCKLSGVLGPSLRAYYYPSNKIGYNSTQEQRRFLNRKQRQKRSMWIRGGYRRCQCPIWMDGSVNGRRVNKSLRVTDWNTAQELVGKLLAGTETIATVKEPEAPPTCNTESLSVSATWERFIAQTCPMPPDGEALDFRGVQAFGGDIAIVPCPVLPKTNLRETPNKLLGCQLIGGYKWDAEMRASSKPRPKDSKQRDAEFLRFSIKEHLKAIPDYLAFIDRKRSLQRRRRCNDGAQRNFCGINGIRT